MTRKPNNTVVRLERTKLGWKWRWSPYPNALEDPRSLVNKTDTERLWIMCFKALDHKFNRCIVLFPALVCIAIPQKKYGHTILAIENPVISNTTQAVSTGFRNINLAVSIV